MDGPAIEVIDEPSNELTEEIRAGLVAYNIKQVGLGYAQPVAVSARQDGELVAGVHGVTLGGWLHVERFWVSEDFRGKGLGTKLLKAIEDVARSRGCTGSYLDTFSFQAKPFYERNGYRQFGELPDFVGDSADPERSFQLQFFCKRL